MLKVGLYGNMPRAGPSQTQYFPEHAESRVPLNTAPVLAGSGGYRIHPVDMPNLGNFGGDTSGTQSNFRQLWHEQHPEVRPRFPETHMPGGETPATQFFRGKIGMVRRMVPGQVLGLRQNNRALK